MCSVSVETGPETMCRVAKFKCDYGDSEKKEKNTHLHVKPVDDKSCTSYQVRSVLYLSVFESISPPQSYSDGRVVWRAVSMWVAFFLVSEFWVTVTSLILPLDLMHVSAFFICPYTCCRPALGDIDGDGLISHFPSETANTAGLFEVSCGNATGSCASSRSGSTESTSTLTASASASGSTTSASGSLTTDGDDNGDTYTGGAGSGSQVQSVCRQRSYMCGRFESTAPDKYSGGLLNSATQQPEESNETAAD